MASSEKELEEQLKDVGNKLLNPPSSSAELLSLLDRLEYYLSKVEQSPSRLMQDALLPSMKALISNEILRNLDIDVKVSVASCISEIMRITAPDAPYSDEQMKEIFQLTVTAFEKLSHVSGRCYSKAISILDTVAKVRSCLVMLDLECDELVIEMFQHFLKIIRSNHPHAVFSDMEAIMTLVLEESEDISWELLCTLLDSVKKENQNVLPMSWKLGEKVIKSCAAKLKPYLMEAVQSMGIVLSDYAQIVASICQNASDMLEQNHINGSGEHLADESKLSEKTHSDEQSQVARGLGPDAVCPGEVGPVLDGSKSMLSNGTAQTMNDDTFVDENPFKRLERCRRTKQSKSIDARGNNKPDNLDSMKVVKSETEPETVPKKRGRRPNSLMNPEEGYDHSWISRRIKAPKIPCCRNYHDKVIDSSPSENPVSKEAALPSAYEKEIEPQVFSPKIAHSETKAASSPFPNCSLPDGSHPKRGWRKKKGSIMNQAADQSSVSVPKEDLFGSQVEDKAPKPADVSLKKESEHTSGLETKPRRRSRKNAIAAKTNGETTPALGDVVSQKVGLNDFEEKPLCLSVMNIGARDTNEEGLSVQRTVGKKRSRGKTTAEKDVTEESGDKKMVSGFTSKSSNKNENHLDKTPKTKSKRKRTPGKEEASETPHSDKDLVEQLIGSRIKVWWPKDKTFYEGVVDSFDHIKKKHKVLYADGDEEILNLRKERWELIRNDLLADEGKQVDLPSHDASSDMRRKKKEKLKSVPWVPSSKQKAVSSSKRSRASVGKSVDCSMLDSPIIIVDHSKDDSFEMDDKLKDDGQVSTGKLKIDSLKTGKKSKWNTPETGGKGKLFELADSLASLTKSEKKRHRGMKIG